MQCNFYPDFHHKSYADASHDGQSVGLVEFIEPWFHNPRRWRRFGSSAKGVAETVEWKASFLLGRRRRSSPACRASTLWWNSVRCRLRQRASRRIWIRTTVGGCEASGRGKQGRLPTGIDIEEREPNASVASTPDAYIRRITDTSSTCLHDSASALPRQGRAVGGNGSVILRVLPPANCMARHTPSRSPRDIFILEFVLLIEYSSYNINVHVPVRKDVVANAAPSGSLSTTRGSLSKSYRRAWKLVAPPWLVSPRRDLGVD